jgi:hypothetical protein
MRTLDDTARLLDLLREAGDEPVSLDELAIVGVVEPAAALEALERAGHALHRVEDLRAEERITCVRLTERPSDPPMTRSLGRSARLEEPESWFADDEPWLAATPLPPLPPLASATPATPAADRRPLVLGALVLALLLLLLGRRGS